MPDYGCLCCAHLEHRTLPPRPPCCRLPGITCVALSLFATLIFETLWTTGMSHQALALGRQMAAEVYGLWFVFPALYIFLVLFRPQNGSRFPSGFWLWCQHVHQGLHPTLCLYLLRGLHLGT